VSNTNQYASCRVCGDVLYTGEDDLAHPSYDHDFEPLAKPARIWFLIDSDLEDDVKEVNEAPPGWAMPV
jgi:hypothetical protein